MKRQQTTTEIFVGIFLILGFLGFGWLAFNLGEVNFLNKKDSYTLFAEFDNISGIKVKSEVHIAGVPVGKVSDLSLDFEYGVAVVTIKITEPIQIPSDSIISVKSKGIIGDKFLAISLGGDEEFLKPNDFIPETVSTLDIESLISKFAFGKVE